MKRNKSQIYFQLNKFCFKSNLHTEKSSIILCITEEYIKMLVTQIFMGIMSNSLIYLQKIKKVINGNTVVCTHLISSNKFVFFRVTWPGSESRPRPIYEAFEEIQS